jgi:hypothetical protein
MEKELAKKHAEFLAKDYQHQIEKFLSKSPLEKLEEIENSLKFSDNPQLFALIQDLKETISSEYYNMPCIEERTLSEMFDGKIWSVINHYLQTRMQYFIQYGFLQELLGSNFSPLGFSEKKGLLEKHNLTPGKLKKELHNFVGQKLDLVTVKNGGSKKGWSKWDKLKFLSFYELFSIVITNARNDYKQMKQAGIAVMDAKQNISEKYRIPLDYEVETQKKETYFSAIKNNTNDVDYFARSWAKAEMQKGLNEKSLKKMGFADSYLIKILEEARAEAEKHIPYNCRNYGNHKLIFLTIGDPNTVQHNFIFNKAGISDLKFDSYVEKEKYGMALYFSQ